MVEQINWSFLQVAIAVIVSLISAAWALSLYQRNRKDLRYDTLAYTSIVNVKEEAAGRIKISFDERPVTEVVLTIIQVVNRGAPISSDDFESPLIIFMGSVAEIFSADVIKVNPQNLNVKINIKNNCEVHLMPLLINCGDSITIKIIGTKFAENVSVLGRIVGVSEIKKEKDIKDYARLVRQLRSYAGFPGIVLMISGIILMIKGATTPISRLGEFLFFFGYFTGLIILLVALHYSWRWRISIKKPFQNRL